MNVRSVINLCLGGLFGLLLIYIITQWHKWDENTVGADGETLVSNYKVVYKLLSCILLAIIGGVFFVMVILPKFGDAVGTMMYSSGEEVAVDDTMRAAAKMAQGDYLGAIDEYEKMMKEKPDDPFPVSEIAKIHSDKLEDPDKALAFLQEHLEAQGWTEENAAFLMFRMVDIELARHQFDSAKDILEQVIANFPGTRHSANAKHKINDVEQAQFKELHAQRAQAQQLPKDGIPAEDVTSSEDDTSPEDGTPA